MKPAFRLRAGGAEVPVGDRLLDLKATSTSDDASDTLELTLDNRDAAVALPPPGGELEAWLGYAPSPRYLGKFLFADLEVSFPPLRLTLRATAADFGRASTLKAPRTRNWPERLTLGRVAETLADAHGYRARVAPALAAVPVENLDQSAESDLALLARLAAARGAAAKADAGHLLVVPRGAGTSVSGKPLAAAIRPEDALSARASHRERTRYASATAKYHDLNSGETETVTAGAGEPVFEVRGLRPTRAAAEAAAEAALADRTRAAAELDLELPGHPDLAAETRLRLPGDWPEGLAGEWTATRVAHSLGSSGYRTRITAERPPDAPSTP